MGRKRKILLSLCIALVAVLALLGGLFYYYYTHPDAIKPLLERSISQATGTRCAIRTLSYSLRPLRIRAQGVRLSPPEQSQGFHLMIPDLTAEMELKGPLGDRTLVIKDLLIRGAAIELHGMASLPDFLSRGARPLSPGGFLRRAVGVFVFRDMEFGEARLVDGRVLIKLSDLWLEMQEIAAFVNPARLVEMHCSAKAQFPSQKMAFQTRELVVRTDRVISLANPVIKAALSARHGVLRTPRGDLDMVEAQADITYSHEALQLDMEPLQLKGTIAHKDLSLHTRARVHIGKGVLEAPSISLDLADTMAVRGAGEMRLKGQGTFFWNILESRFMPEKVLEVIPEDLQKDLPPLPLFGPVQVRGTLEGRREKGGWALTPDVQIQLNQNPFSYQDNAFQLQGVLTGLARIGGTSPELTVSLQMQGENMVVSGQGFNTFLSHLDLQSHGIVNILQKSARTVGESDGLALVLNDVLEIKGGARWAFAPAPRIGLQCKEGRVLTHKILPLLPVALRNKIPPVHMEGPLHFSGAVEGKRIGERWRWHTDVRARLNQNPLAYEGPGMGLQGRVSGELRLKGAPPNPEVFADLEWEKATLSSPFLTAEPMQGRLVVSGKEGTYHLRDGSLHIPSLHAKVGQQGVTFRDIRVVCPDGTLDPRQGLYHLPEIRMDTALVKNLLLSLKREKGRTAVDLQGKEIGLLALARSLDALPRTWQWAGKDRFQVSAASTDLDTWQVTAGATFEELTFENPEASCIGEKVSLITGFQGEILPRAGTVSGRASLEAKAGEVLYDRFYFDLGRTPFSVSLEGKGDGLNKTVALSRGTLGLKNIAVLHLEGHIRAAEEVSADVQLRLPMTPLKPLFEHLVAAPFQTAYPPLAALQIGGTLSAEVQFKGSPEEWTARGSSRLRQGIVSSSEKHMALKGIDLDLPVWLETRASEHLGDPVRGKLSIREMVLPLLENRPLVLPLEARANRLAIPGPTRLATAAGDVEVGPVLGRDLLSPGRAIRTSLAFNDLRVAPLLANVWPRPLPGEIQGRLDPIEITSKRLSSAGEVLARIFGGTIRFHDLRVTNPFSRMPALGLSAEWQDLSLEQITAQTPFGKVEGILQGHVKDLEIANGQPQGFSLFLETVERKGINQKISQLAVKNIAQVAGGEDAAMGMSGGLAFFLKDYESPYKKIGIRASLRNDRFKVNGTIHEEGKEYLIKRPWHSGVEVINWEPDNSISWKTMMKRIRNVSVSSEQGPIMK